MKEQFKEYLLQNGYSQNSANSYVSGLNHISKDHRNDIFQITDLTILITILSKYDLNGSKRSVGDYGNGTARNALVQYRNFLEDNKNNGSIDSLPSPEAPSSDKNLRRFSYERDLHNTLKEQVTELFPGYKLIGSEYSIEGVRLDLLLEKDENLLVVELKAGTATYEVFGQISMYIGLVKSKFPSHAVSGLIIANDIHKGLEAACTTHNNISCKRYIMQLKLN